MTGRAFVPVLHERDDEEVLRDACRRVLQGELPVARVRALAEAGEHPGRALWPTVVELGWTGIVVPEEHGGAGLGLMELTVLAEEHGREVQPGPLLSSAVCGLALARHGTAAQQAAWLPAMAAGALVGAWSVDVDGTAGAVTAVPDADGSGGVRLSGRRLAVAETRDAHVLLADARCPDGRHVMALVPLDAPGVSTRAATTLDLLRAYDEVAFEDVAVPPADVLGAGAGADDEAIRHDVAALGTVVQCAESLGAATRLVEDTVAYARDRRQFGRAIASFQAIKHRLADMRIKLEAGRAAMRYAAWAVQHRRPDARRAVHVAKQWVGESTSWIASEALQVHGGIGFTWEHDLHLYLRRIKANELTLGSPDWHSRRLGDELAGD